VGNIAQLIQKTSKRGTEGVLLAVRQGAVTSQALRIDGRSGTLKVVGSALVAPRTEAARASRAAGALMTAVATVPLTSLKLYGNAAVFSTLPPSTLGAAGGEVKIGLSGPGSFTNVAAPNNAIPSITLPPALKDRATLQRFSTAFKDYQRVMLPPADSLVIVRAVDFATAASAAATRARVDANRTVPARLASTLSLGAQAVGFADGALAHQFISASLDGAFIDWLRYVVPHTFDRASSSSWRRMCFCRVSVCCPTTSSWPCRPIRASSKP
jgi:hypothetical protein